MHRHNSEQSTACISQEASASKQNAAAAVLLYCFMAGCFMATLSQPLMWVDTLLNGPCLCPAATDTIHPTLPGRQLPFQDLSQHNMLRP
jgi:hypothetical protein